MNEKILQTYLDRNFTGSKTSAEIKRFTPQTENEEIRKVRFVTLNEFINADRNPEFRRVLSSVIEESGMEKAECLKKAGLASFNEDKPSKKDVIALVMALELNTDEADRLLKSAGYGFDNCSYTDLIVRCFITYGDYDRAELNKALVRYGEKPL